MAKTHDPFVGKWMGNHFILALIISLFLFDRRPVMDYGVLLISTNVQYVVPIDDPTPQESTVDIPPWQVPAVTPVVHNNSDTFHVLRLHAIVNNGMPDIYKLTHPDPLITPISSLTIASSTPYQPSTSPVSDIDGNQCQSHSPREPAQSQSSSPGPPSLDYEGPPNLHDLSPTDSDLQLTHYSPPPLFQTTFFDDEIPTKRFKNS